MHRLALFGFAEDGAEVFFSLPNVFAHDAREIDLEKFKREFVGKYFRSHCLAGSGRSGEEGVEALAAAELLAKAPILMHAPSVFHPSFEALELVLLFSWQHDVVPAVTRVDANREAANLCAGERAPGVEQVLRSRLGG